MWGLHGRVNMMHQITYGEKLMVLATDNSLISVDAFKVMESVGSKWIVSIWVTIVLETFSNSRCDYIIEMEIFHFSLHSAPVEELLG